MLRLRILTASSSHVAIHLLEVCGAHRGGSTPHGAAHKDNGSSDSGTFFSNTAFRIEGWAHWASCLQLLMLDLFNLELVVLHG